MTITRASLIRRSAVAGGLVVGSALARVSLERASGATAAPPLDVNYSTPFRPGLGFAAPGGWSVSSDFLPDVVEPRHVGVSNREITITRTLDGIPDIRGMDADAALLLAFVEPLTPEHVTDSAHPLGQRLRFADLGHGLHDATPGVGTRYFAWYASDSVAVTVYLLVGVAPAPGWHAVEGVMNSMRLI